MPTHRHRSDSPASDDSEPPTRASLSRRAFLCVCLVVLSLNVLNALAWLSGRYALFTLDRGDERGSTEIA